MFSCYIDEFDGPAGSPRTAADLVFVLAPKVKWNGAGMLIDVMFSYNFANFGVPCPLLGLPGPENLN